MTPPKGRKYLEGNKTDHFQFYLSKDDKKQFIRGYYIQLSEETGRLIKTTKFLRVQ